MRFCNATKFILSLSLMALVLALPDGRADAARKSLAIGTGGPSGVYFVVGNAICQMIHKQGAALKTKSKDAVRCSAPSTGGSIQNIESIRNGELELGLAQSDWQYHASKGSSSFEGRKFDKLRSLFSIHAEPFQILVGKDSGIKSWEDLKGKRVNIGNPGSGQRGTFEVVMLAHNVDGSYFGTVSELTSTEQSKALCDGKIDAYGYTVGVPNAGVAQAADGCGARILDLDDKPEQKLVAETPYYAFSTIPEGTYTTTRHDIKTFGVLATLVTSAELSNDAAYNIVRAVFENLDEFRKLHPSLKNLDPKKMIKDGLSAPLHPGAIKYYKEKGWL